MSQDEDDFSSMLKRVRAASADAPQQPPPPKRGAATKAAPARPLVSYLIAPAIIAVFFLLVLYGFSSIARWSATRYVRQATANTGNAAIRKRQLQLKRLERYRVPIDTTITPLEAGKILHALQRAGHDGDLLPWEQPVENPIAPYSCCEDITGNPSRLFDPKGDWASTAFVAARRGLTPEQRRFLTGTARNPAVAHVRRLARARGADVGGGLWSVPADSVVGWPELPAMRSQQLRAAWSGNLANAVLDFEAGRNAQAEQRVREVISVGFVFQDGARSMTEEASSGIIISTGRMALEALYRGLGRTRDADSVSAKADPQIALGPWNERLPDNVDSILRHRILDTTQLTSTRWQLALGAFAHLPCTERRYWFLGPNAAHRATQKEIRAALVKYPSDERRFEMQVRTAWQLLDPMARRTSPSRGSSRGAQTMTRLTGNNQFEKCSTLLYR